MKTSLTRSSLFTMILGLTLLSACGGAEKTEQAAGSYDDGIRTIQILGVDEMKFVVSGPVEGVTTGAQYGANFKVETISAAPGEELRIVLSSVSVLPATAMAHNFVLLTKEADVDAFARESINARDNGYIAPAMTDWVIVHTKMLGGGETDAITFTAPIEPGEYTFICSFPGHYAGGMVGKLIVG